MESKRRAGRPKKEVNVTELREIYLRLKSLRRATEEYNIPRKGVNRISHEHARRALKIVMD